MTRTTELLQIGLEATTFVLIRQMLSVAFEAVEVFGLSAARILPVPTSGRPVALRIVTVNHVPGDFGSLFFFFVHFPRFLKFLAPRLEKNTNFAMRLSRQAHDREICRRHFEAHLALW